MNFRQEIKQIVEVFIPEVEKNFLTVFELGDLNFGRDLATGDRTGAIDWYSSEGGNITANVMISIGCSSRLSAEIEKTTEALYARHGVFQLNESVKRSLNLSTAKIQLNGEVSTATAQQTSSRLWVAVITFQIVSFIGL